MSVYIPPAGNPQVYVKIKNMGEKEKKATCILNQEFWKQEGEIEIK